VRKLHLAAALLGLLAATPAIHAQRLRVRDVPPRPALWAGADTNSANAYYLHGVQRIETDAPAAAAAFYWAERLNPGWPEALFARRVALLMSDPLRLTDYMQGRSYELEKPEVLAIDSLVLRANQRDPFLVSPMEKTLWMAYFRTIFREATRQSVGGTDAGVAENWLQDALFNADPSFRAWLDFISGRYAPAVQGYQRALRTTRQTTELRLQLGRAQFMAGEYAAAAATLADAIARYRADDRRDIVHLYQSKAAIEFTRAAALEQLGDTAGATQALARTLEEDLAFWAAHRRLAQRAAERGDQETALAEMALTVELAPGEADLRYEYAALLMLANQLDPAVAQLRKAIELNPYYPLPHYLLALLNDQSQVVPVAIDHYNRFLELAPRDDARRANAEARLAALSAPAPAPAAP
jgi:tetratricopeptide (TPR) repeat protein